jgi:hypothetical protein
MGGACSSDGEGEVCTGFWWGNLRERGQWGRPNRRWENNIKMDVQEVECVVMDWIGLAQDRDTCECGNELSGSIKCREFFY